MTYRVIIPTRAQRMIDDLPKEVRRNVIKHLIALQLDPRPSGYIKLKGEEGYRIRVGDYRIVYMIDDKAVTVTIERVRHRSNVYR